jgi:hypothetical protein
LTPFDRLGGFERRVEGNNAADNAAVPANTHEIQAASIAKVGEQVRRQRAERHTTKLVDSSKLPRTQRHAKKVDEHFWRALGMMLYLRNAELALYLELLPGDNGGADTALAVAATMVKVKIAMKKVEVNIVMDMLLAPVKKRSY